MVKNNLVQKLEDFFDLSKKKQQKKQDKLLKIISNLEQKKVELEKQVVLESEIDETSERYQELSKELMVLSKLIRKAKKKEHSLAGE